MFHRLAVGALCALAPSLVACSAGGALRSDDLQESWAAEPAARLRPPATLVFDRRPTRQLYLCFGGEVYACPESGAGDPERIWDSGRPVAAIAPVGGDQGMLVVEAATNSGGARERERVVWLKEGDEPRVLYEADDRLLGTPLRVGSREAWLATARPGGDEDAVLVNADMQGRRPPQLRSARLDAVYHIARNPHTGVTHVSGARRTGRRVEAGVFAVADAGEEVELVDPLGWAPTWSSHGTLLATARGRRDTSAALLRYGPLRDCVIRVEETGCDRVLERPVDGVVLAMCFDPADESLLFAAVGDPAEAEADDLRTVRLVRVRIGRDRLQLSEIARVTRSGY